MTRTATKTTETSYIVMSGYDYTECVFSLSLQHCVSDEAEAM